MSLNIPGESPESLQSNSIHYFTNTFETKSGWYVLCGVPLRHAEMCLFRPTSQPTGVYIATRRLHDWETNEHYILITQKTLRAKLRQILRPWLKVKVPENRKGQSAKYPENLTRKEPVFNCNRSAFSLSTPSPSASHKYRSTTHKNGRRETKFALSSHRLAWESQRAKNEQNAWGGKRFLHTHARAQAEGAGCRQKEG